MKKILYSFLLIGSTGFNIKSLNFVENPVGYNDPEVSIIKDTQKSIYDLEELLEKLSSQLSKEKKDQFRNNILSNIEDLKKELEKFNNSLPKFRY